MKLKYKAVTIGNYIVEAQKNYKDMPARLAAICLLETLNEGKIKRTVTYKGEQYFIVEV